MLADVVARTDSENVSNATELAAPPAADEPRTPATSPPVDTAIGTMDVSEASAGVHGHVRDQASREQISDAHLYFAGRETRTDENGDFHFDGLPVGRGDTLAVRLAGYADVSRTLETLKPGDNKVDIELVRVGLTLHVSVIDRESGGTVTDAVVTADEGGVVGEREADGSFPVEVAEDNKLSLNVTAGGYCDFHWIWQVRWRDEESRKSIPLLRAAWIEGTVSDEERKPLERAWIYTYNTAIPFGHLVLSEAERAKHNLAGYAFHQTSSDVWSTDASGRFRKSVIPSEHVTLVNVSARPRVSQQLDVRAEIPGGTTVVDVVLERGATIRGRVSKNGKPWWGSVRCESPSGTHVSSTRAKDGEYALTGIPRGTALVKLMTPGEDVPEREATLPIPDYGTYEQDFIWQEELATIAGRVVNSARQPVAGASVNASVRIDEDRDLDFGATTASDGSFSIDVVTEHSYTVKAMHRGVRVVDARREDVAAGTNDIELVLPDFGRLRLRLVEAESSAPVRRRMASPSLSFLWRKSRDERYQTHFEPKTGSSEVTLDLPVGSIDLVVNLQKEGYLPWSLSGFGVEVGPTKELEVRLTRGVDARVDLLAETDEPFSSLREHEFFLLEATQLDFVRGPFPEDDSRSNIKANGIRMWLQDPAMLNQMLSIDDTGTALLRGLAPGQYALRALPADLDIEPAFVTVSSGAKAHLQFRWRSRK